MSQVAKFLTVGLLGAGLSGLMIADAQPPAGERGRDKRPGEPARPRGEQPKGDPQVQSWVKSLLEKITDPHDTIRESARAAVVTVGEPAIPQLSQLAEGPDGAKSTAARKLIEAIEQQQRMAERRRAMRDRFPGGPPFGEFGEGRMRGEFRGGPPGENPDRGRPEGRPEGERRPEGEPRPEGRPDRGRPEGERRPEGRPEGRPQGERRPGDATAFDEAIKSLKLEENKQKKLNGLVENYTKAMSKIREEGREGRINPDEIREVRMNLMKQLRELLSDEQFERVADAMRNSPFGPGGPPAGRGRPGPDGPREGGERPRPDRQ